MRNSYLFYKLAIVTCAVFAFASCSKDNGINNTTVIATPYSLYFCDSSGSLINTNDGIFFKKRVFDADGVPSLAIATADTNLLWIKTAQTPGGLVSNMVISTNNGVSFNPTYAFLNPAAFDQTMVLYVPDLKVVYITTGDGIYNGVKYSPNYGNAKTWHEDSTMPAVTNCRVTSFTELKDHTLVAFDWTTQSIFIKPNPTKTSPWTPAVVTTPLPVGGQFTVSHFNNTIVAVDRTGVNGAWYSPNYGVSWYQYSLPAELTGVPLLCAYAPFESNLLLGTQNKGVYVLQGTTFAPWSNGLTDGTSVRSMVAKENIYVNGVSVQYVYIATSKGIFRSEDQGQNWVSIRSGNYFSVD